MADLWERLRAAHSRQVPIEEPEPPQKKPPEEAPAGWSWVTPLVAERRQVFGLEPRFWRETGTGLEVSDWDQVLCFDTETTGLSGGAGTVAFLVGWARLLPPVSGQDSPQVEIRQWFLRDHPGEPDLIAAIDEALASARGLVSFNGASFDLPLLRSRWTLAGRNFPPRPHRDDLHPSRRLWKNLLESCKLSRLEQDILGIHRLDDVPGALVPALWFDYLRAGASADFLTPLEGVLRHHAQDVYSLLCLDLLLAALRRNPESPLWQESFTRPGQRQNIHRPAPGGLLHPDLGRAIPVDFWGLLRFRDEASAERHLQSAWSVRGDEPLGMAWADKLKRRGDHGVMAIWTTLWETKRSYPALEELLKWLEHRVKTPEARALALTFIHQGLQASFLPRVWREGLEKRRNRLSRFPPSAAP